MNYQKVYDSIINRARQEKRRKKQGTYFEAHHIIPRCLNGNNSATNLVLLTAREHFICHWLLSRIYPNNPLILLGFWRMCGSSNKKQERYKPSSRAFEEARNNMSKAISTIQKGKLKTFEHKAKIANTLTGKTHSEEANKKKGRRGTLNTNWGKTTQSAFKPGKENPQSKKVQDIKTGRIFESCSEAAKYYGLANNTITYRLKTGKLKIV
jgi:hypothetical protein